LVFANMLSEVAPAANVSVFCTKGILYYLLVFN
jgi:hypothetical protein